LLIYLTPSVPLSFKGEREDIKKRGFASLEVAGHVEDMIQYYPGKI